MYDNTTRQELGTALFYLWFVAQLSDLSSPIWFAARLAYPAVGMPLGHPT